MPAAQPTQTTLNVAFDATDARTDLHLTAKVGSFIYRAQVHVDHYAHQSTASADVLFPTGWVELVRLFPGQWRGDVTAPTALGDKHAKRRTELLALAEGMLIDAHRARTA